MSCCGQCGGEAPKENEVVEKDQVEETEQASEE